MDWNVEEKTTKKGMETSSKILLAIIACVLLIIILIVVLLIHVQSQAFSIIIDEKSVTADADTLLTTIDNVTYVNIEEFAKLVGYDYHKGEYKAFTIEEDKCYVQGPQETATFYLNDRKVCKLPVDALTEDYQEYSIDNTIKSQNDKMYAPVSAINLAFNVVIEEKTNSFTVYTLDHLVSIYDGRVKQWGYSGISDQNFENKKSLLYGYLIVKKEGGLYKIIDNQNQREIVSDKYNAIQFTENTQEFFVTNSLGQVGIINLDGTTKIEPIYDSITVLDKKSDLYLIQKSQKYGVVKSGNVTIIYPEYDRIGMNTEKLANMNNIENQYLILDTLIPVCKNNKYGAFDKEGNLVLKVEYDGLGCSLTTVEVNGVKKAVLPVLAIERCKGIVVEKAKKYGLLDLTGKELVPIAVENIYALENVEEEDAKYFMLYNGKELNIIDRLIKANLIKPTTEETEKTEPDHDNTMSTNTAETDPNTNTNTSTNSSSNQVTTNAVAQ